MSIDCLDVNIASQSTYSAANEFGPTVILPKAHIPLSFQDSSSNFINPNPILAVSAQITDVQNLNAINPFILNSLPDLQGNVRQQQVEPTSPDSDFRPFPYCHSQSWPGEGPVNYEDLRALLSAYGSAYLGLVHNGTDPRVDMNCVAYGRVSRNPMETINANVASAMVQWMTDRMGLDLPSQLEFNKTPPQTFFETIPSFDSQSNPIWITNVKVEVRGILPNRYSYWDRFANAFVVRIAISRDAYDGVLYGFSDYSQNGEGSFNVVAVSEYNDPDDESLDTVDQVVPVDSVPRAASVDTVLISFGISYGISGAINAPEGEEYINVLQLRIPRNPNSSTSPFLANTPNILLLAHGMDGIDLDPPTPNVIYTQFNPKSLWDYLFPIADRSDPYSVDMSNAQGLLGNPIIPEWILKLNSSKPEYPANKK